MFAKLGFLIIVLLFGGLMFTAGILSPNTLRDSITTKISAISSAIGLKIKTPESGSNAKVVSGSSVPATTVETPKPNKDTAADALPYDVLLLPVSAVDGARYAVEAGIFENVASGGALIKQLGELGYPVKTINVVDREKTPWVIVAAGSYASSDDARSARSNLSRQLGTAQKMNVIQLPPEKKK